MPDATGEVQQEESKYSISSSAGVKDTKTDGPLSTKWKELSWDSVSESSPASIDNASSKEQQRSYRTEPRDIRPNQSSAKDSTELQMFADEDEEDEPTPQVLAKESSARRPKTESRKSPTLYDEDDYY